MPHTIEVAREYAAKRGGICRTTIYKSCTAVMEWTCSRGHKWDAPLNRIKQGHWCRKCSTLRLSELHRDPQGLKTAQTLGEQIGLTCLSTEYINIHLPLQWRCSAGHEYPLSLDCLRKNKGGCARCSGYRPIKTDRLEIARSVAIKRAGICLSAVYENKNDHLRWRCAMGHEWRAGFGSVVDQQTWCPKCFRFKRENECRTILRSITGYEFHGFRAPWLGRMELDGFAKEINIAFEYQGVQHYTFTPHFHKGEPFNLVAQQIRDFHKALLCVTHKIELIVIPHFVTNVEIFIRKQLELIQLKRSTPPVTDEEVYDLIEDVGD